MASFLVLDCNAPGCLVDVTLYDMSVKASVHHHGALDIDLVADLQHAYVAALECLAHGGDGVCTVGNPDYGKAYAVMCDALVDLELVDKGA